MSDRVRDNEELDDEADEDYKLYERKTGGPAVIKVTSDMKYAKKNGVKKLVENKWAPKKDNYVKCNVKENLKKKKVSMSAPVSAAVNLDPGDMITDLVNNCDRPGGSEAKGAYTMTHTHVSKLINQPGERIPKVEAFAGAGVGRASAHISVCEAEANGPNAKAGAYASALGAGAMASAEIASASARAGPVGVKVGLGVDTGARIGVTGVEAKVLGTGFKIGPETSISLLGSEVSCCIQ